MNMTKPVSSFLIGAAIVGAAALFVATSHANASQDSARSMQSSDWLSLQEVIARLETAGYSAFEEIERESDGYEVKALDPEGRRVEIDIDPVSGDILKTEVKRDKSR